MTPTVPSRFLFCHTYLSRSVTYTPRYVNRLSRRTRAPDSIRIETRIEDFPLRGQKFSTGMAKWVNEASRICLWRRHAPTCISLAISSISVPSGCAYPGHSRSPTRSYIVARFRRECQSVDNLFERRASNVSHLRNRANLAPALAAFWISRLFRACPLCDLAPRRGVVELDLFRRYRPAVLINESQLQFRPDAHFYSGGNVTARAITRASTTNSVPARVP